MEFYLFCKRFFIWLGNAPAKALHARGVTPNAASQLAAVVIAPLIAPLVFMPMGVGFWVYLPVLLLAKLVLNAVDGIIARLRGDSSKIGMVWNVSTDIVPDAMISGIVLWRLGVPDIAMTSTMAIFGAYLVMEYVFIFRYGMQNMYFSKDLRTFFFVIIAVSAFFEFPAFVYPTYYAFIFLLHQSGFHPHLRERMARRFSSTDRHNVRGSKKSLR